MTTQLSTSQQLILKHATQSTDGKLDWFPDNIKGGARKKVLDSLFNRALITPLGDDWMVAAEGYDALGLPRPEPASTPNRKSRDNSKQAQVIAMLKRPEGATIPQIMESTGWQAHTVRGTFAGAFKKKLGLTLISEKPEGSNRVYRIS